MTTLENFYFGNVNPSEYTNSDISGDICRKFDHTFVTEIFEVYQDSAIQSIRHSRMGEIALRYCVLYCSKQGICTANSKYNSPQSCCKSLGTPYGYLKNPEYKGIRRIIRG